jgi:hypothetical protein
MDIRMTWKRLAFGFGLCSLGTWFVALYLIFYYLNTNPTNCQPALGKIYPLNNHGQIAYIDFGEKCTLNGLYSLPPSSSQFVF